MSERLCVVTGGAGFIGTAVAPRLVELFDQVVVADNLHPQIHPSGKRPAGLPARVELLVEDVTDAGAWDRVLARGRPSVILHLAAETGTGQSLTEATRHAQVNLVGLTRMLDALSRHSLMPEQILLTSSRAVYGEGAWRHDDGTIFYPGQRSAEMLGRGEWTFPGATPLPSDAATTVPHPTSIYGATKLAQEHVLQAWALSFGVRYSILRLQNVYGPGQSLINPYTGIVSLFARLARDGRSIPLYEDGQMLRNFVFIDDVADALARCCAGSAAADRMLDIGSNATATIAEIATRIAARYGAPPPHISGAFRNGDVRFASCTTAHAAATLGWAPRWDIAEGLNALCSWIDDNAGRPH